MSSINKFDIDIKNIRVKSINYHIPKIKIFNFEPIIEFNNDCELTKQLCDITKDIPHHSMR